MPDLNFVLIGNGSKMLGCGEKALQEHHRIHMICSEDADVRDWFTRKGIPAFMSVRDLSSKIKDIPNNAILLSLDNFEKISIDIINHFRWALNCHNSLLPQYGGVHPVSWALLNQEEEVGITFHMMTEVFDQGDIVLQKAYQVQYAELTTLLDTVTRSLDQLAITAFSEELLLSLENGNFVTSLQSATGKSYFSIENTLPDQGFIDTNKTVAEIRRFVAALPKSSAINWLGTAKIYYREMLFIVENTSQTKFSGVYPGQIGEIVQVEKDRILIQVKDGIIVFNGLTRFNGEPIGDLTKIFVDGERLSTPPLAILEALKTQRKPNWQIERKLHNRFRYQIQSPKQSLPEIDRLGNCREPIILDYLLPKKLQQQLSEAEHLKWAKQQLLLAAILFYLGRLNDYTEFVVVYENSQQWNSLADGEKNLFGHRFLKVTIDPESSFALFFQKIREQTNLLEQEPHVHQDCFYRNQKLAFLRDLSIGFVIGSRWSRVVDTASLPDITFIVEEDKITLRLKGNIHPVQDKDRIHSIFLRIQNLLESFTDSEIFGNTPCKDLSMLTHSELEKLLAVGNFNPIKKLEAVTDARSVLVEKITPSRQERRLLALVSSDDYTYVSLHEKADCFCRFLFNKLPPQGGIIAICLDNSTLAIILVISAMKLGCTILPLNPKHTNEKIDSILQTTNPSVVLTYKQAMGKMTNFQGQVICLDPNTVSNIYHPEVDIVSISDEAITARRCTSYNNDLLLICTSGTTSGTIKIVRVQPQAFLNSMMTRLDYYQSDVAGSMRLALLMSPTFDTWFAAVFWCLMSKGIIYLLPGHVLRCTSLENIQAIVKLINGEELTDLICVPALYQRILDCPTGTQLSKLELPSLERVVVGGDVLSENLIAQHKVQSPNSELVVEYGLTEAGVFSTTHRMIVPGSPDNPLSVGAPIGGNKIILLDKHNNPVPEGHIGIVAIGGNQLSPGYFAAPDLDKARFRKIKIGAEEYDVFITSDLMFCDGKNFIFKGRNDFLLKVGGLFVNIEEIIDILREHPAIRDVVCLVTRKKELAVFIVPHDLETSMKRSTVFEYLRERLPIYMLPSKIIFKSALPLTYHHKIDRLALATEAESLKERGSEGYIKPETPIMLFLATLWATILGFDRMGIEDDFFAFGGKSLLVIDMLNKVQRRYHVQIRPEFIYQQSTIHCLSEEIVRRQQVELKQAGAKKGLPCQLEQDLAFKNKLIELTRPTRISSSASSTNMVVVIGATGYLGRHVIAKLLSENSDSQKIVCIVRMKSVNKFSQMLDNSCFSEKWRDRIEIIVGELSEEKFGLDIQKYNYLRDNATLIINCAGEVSHTVPYSCLRTINVSLVDSIIELAYLGERQADIIHVSSLSCALLDENNELSEQVSTIPLTPKKHQQLCLLDAYNQSKFVAEQRLHMAKELGLNIAILRPTWILLPEQSPFKGSGDKQDFVFSMLVGCAQMKKAPILPGVWLDGIPVDRLASTLLSIIPLLKEQISHRVLVYNISNPAPMMLSDIFQMTIADKIDMVEHGSWYQDMMSVDDDNLLYSFQLLLEGMSSTLEGDLLVLINSNIPAIRKDSVIVRTNAQTILLTQNVPYNYSAYRDAIQGVIDERALQATPRLMMNRTDSRSWLY